MPDAPEEGTMADDESKLRKACPHGYFEAHWGDSPFGSLANEKSAFPTCKPTVPTSNDLITELERQGWGVPPLINLLPSPNDAEAPDA